MAKSKNDIPVTRDEKRQAMAILMATGGPFDDNNDSSALFRKLLKMDIEDRPDEDFRRRALAQSLKVSPNQVAVYVSQIRRVLKARYSAGDIPDLVTVTLPRGSYRPVFQRREASSEADEQLRFSIESWNGPRVWQGVIVPYQRKAKRTSLSILELSSLSAALCQAAYWGDRPSSELRKQAISSAREAVKMVEGETASPELSSIAHLGRASVAAAFERKFSSADKEYREAIRIDPNNAFARAAYAINVLSPSQRHDEALTEATLAVKSDPRSPYTHSNLAWVHFYARRYDPAIERWHTALHFFSDGFSPRYGTACALGEKGAWDECFATFDGILEEWPGQPYITALVGHYKAKQKDERAAHRILNSLLKQRRTSHVSPYGLALIHAGLGDVDEAFHYLAESEQEGDIRLIFIDVIPAWRVLRKDRRYVPLCQGLQLPQFLKDKSHLAGLNELAHEVR